MSEIFVFSCARTGWVGLVPASATPVDLFSLQLSQIKAPDPYEASNLGLSHLGKRNVLRGMNLSSIQKFGVI